MNCSKCIHFEMCKYVDKLPEIQEKFPFVSDFTCKFMVKPSDSKKIEGKTKTEEKEAVVNEMASNKTPEVSVPKKRARKTPAKPASESENSAPDSFNKLPIDSVFGENKTAKALKDLGCQVVEDIYSLDVKKLGAKLTAEINTKLGVFNQRLLEK